MNDLKIGDIVVVNEERIGMIYKITKDYIEFVMMTYPREEMIEYEHEQYYLIDRPAIREATELEKRTLLNAYSWTFGYKLWDVLDEQLKPYGLMTAAHYKIEKITE